MRRLLRAIHYLMSGSNVRATLTPVHVPNFGGLSGSEDKSEGDNSIQFINFGRVGDKVLKNGDKK